MALASSAHIKLNIGGVHYETTPDTLKKASYFDSYIERWNNEEEIFVDRDGKAFRHVLNLLRDSAYDFPPQHKLELDFYGINYVERIDVEGKISDIEKTVNDLMKKIDILMTRIKPGDICQYKTCNKKQHYNKERFTLHSYCRDHLCQCVGCDSPVVGELHDFCIKHLCRKEGCKNRVHMIGGTRCIKHLS